MNTLIRERNIKRKFTDINITFEGDPTIDPAASVVKGIFRAHTAHIENKPIERKG
jgi:hypothetical protein